MKRKVNFNKNNANVVFLFEDNKLVFENGAGEIKYLKGVFANTPRFKEKCLNEIVEKVVEFWKVEPTNIADILEDFESATPFTYKEAFAIENNTLKAKVFGSVSITEMIKSLGATRVKVDGIESRHKIYSSTGEFIKEEKINNIYELYEVNGEQLGVNEKLYCIKCWCTTTEKEHWLWIEAAYKDDVLNAVASTFRVHSNIIPHIKEIKRQGDVLILEMKQEVKPEGEIVPLTKDQYFGLLTSQS